MASGLYRQAAEVAEVRWVRTRRDTQVPMVWLRNKAARSNGSDASEASSPSAEPPLVLLHCHGNATDIGMMMGPYYELSKILGIEVVGVEYSGYGAASGRPSSGNCYADVEAVYDHLVSLGIPSNRIIAYGQSIGSGPVSGLAVKRQLGGIILHSPLLSGIKVIDPEPEKCCRPSCVYKCFDFFPNDRNVKNFTNPYFIMHGQRDDVVPFYHGLRLHSVGPKAYRWPGYFPDRAGHNDIVETDMRAYFGEVSNFLQDVKRRAQGIEVNPPAEGAKIPKKVSRSKPSVVVAEMSQPGQRSGASAERRPEAEASGATPSLLLPTGDFIGAVTEVKAGPEDGRYQAIRAKGDISLATCNARELRSDVPSSRNNS